MMYVSKVVEAVQKIVMLFGIFGDVIDCGSQRGGPGRSRRCYSCMSPYYSQWWDVDEVMYSKVFAKPALTDEEICNNPKKGLKHKAMVNHASTPNAYKFCQSTCVLIEQQIPATYPIKKTLTVYVRGCYEDILTYNIDHKFDRAFKYHSKCMDGITLANLTKDYSFDDSLHLKTQKIRFCSCQGDLCNSGPETITNVSSTLLPLVIALNCLLFYSVRLVTS